jgi:hypothetical protein
VIFPAAVSAALLVGLCLQWPSLEGGFRGDDYVQWAMLRGTFPAPRSQFDLFDFASGEPDEYRKLVDFGHLPWWSDPKLRLRMWRPLASASMAFDFQHFGTQAQLHHWHSLAWYVLLLLAAARLLGQILPPLSAGLALVCFAASPCHTLPVGWLANRSTLIATALGFLAIDLYLRWLRARSLPKALAVALVAGLALLSGEYAVSALLYAFVIPVAGARPRDRLLAWLPISIPLIGYLALHSLVGSDVIGSGFYVSPTHDPLGFGKALLMRGPVLAADLLFGIPSLHFNGGSPLRNLILSWNIFTPGVWVQLPDWPSWHVLIGYLAVASAALLVHWLTRGPAQHDRSHALRWLSLGTGLSLVPCAGSLPEDRLLVAATLGSSALIASALVQVWPLVWRAAALRARLGATVLALLLLWVPARGAWRSYSDVRGMLEGSEVARVWARAAELPDRTQPDSRVYLLNNVDFNSAVNLPWLRLMEHHPLPRAYRRLCPGALPVDVTRSGERVLEVRVLTNALRGTVLPSLYRSTALPVQVGERVDLPGLRVEVLEVYDGNPSQLRFSFDRSLDDPGLWFLTATEDGLQRSAMPAIGASMRVPYAQFRDLRR